MIFNNSSGKTRSLNISSVALKWWGGGFFSLVVLLLLGVYLSYGSEIKELSYNKLKQENQEYYRELKGLNSDYESIKETLSQLIEKEEQLELLLGKAIVKKKK